MCNLYASTRPPRAIAEATGAMVIEPAAGNLQPLDGIHPDQSAPIVRQDQNGRRLTMARWGLPKPAFALQGKKVDSGVTNVRNTGSAHWRRWLGVANRCLVPWTRFSEPGRSADGKYMPVWFDMADPDVVPFFAGIWLPQWRSVRKVKEGAVTADLFAFLTTEAKAEVGAVHPKAMPVILTTAAEIETWLMADWAEARRLQKPLADGRLRRLAPS
ncbi:SOS response-associated peptidase family protein [Phaeobacter sp.]|uniref:SOS response-associated peptidase n=1 Tax=Phaeobacter sp. TaxID=1902409 RepID=UPI0025D1BF7A|nr:SOS response-associated peptidase family protein [Phaeobacter sp.]